MEGDEWDLALPCPLAFELVNVAFSARLETASAYPVVTYNIRDKLTVYF